MLHGTRVQYSSRLCRSPCVTGHTYIDRYIHTYLDGDGDGRLNTEEGDVDFDSDGAPDCLDTVIRYPNNTTPTTGGEHVLTVSDGLRTLDRRMNDS